MRTKRLTLTSLDDLRPGDVVTAINGYEVGPRTVKWVQDGCAETTSPDNRPTGITWMIYAAQIHSGLTVTRSADRGYANLIDAARAWGKAQGIVNRGGSLYWDADSPAGVSDLVSYCRGRLGYKTITATRRFWGKRETVVTGYLVTGYHPTKGAKGWQVLGHHLLILGLVTEVDGRYHVRQGF